MVAVAVTLISKPECHLCDAARDVVASVVAQLTAETSAASISVTEVSILDDAALLAQYSEEVPVVLIDGRVHNIWRVDPTRFRSALLAASDPVQ
jgi:glutaredoxin